jgi:hypothetical protein
LCQAAPYTAAVKLVRKMTEKKAKPALVGGFWIISDCRSDSED